MSAWLPSLYALRAFAASARLLSFEQASRELGVTPAAVKQLVRKLEAQVGAALIERAGRGLRLTDAGKRGLADLEAGFDSISQGVSKMRSDDTRRRLVLSVEPSFASLWLVPRLGRFQKLAPNVDVLINSSLHLVDLSKNEADIAIRFGSSSGHSRMLSSHRLFNEVLAVFGSQSIATNLARGGRLTDLPLIHWDTASLAWAETTKRWWDWKAWLHHVGDQVTDPDRHVRLSIEDYNLAVNAAIAGQGLLLGSLPVLKSLVANGMLVQVRQETVHLDLGYDIVTKSGHSTQPEISIFIDWIRTEALDAAAQRIA